jgi:hypothetical protein
MCRTNILLILKDLIIYSILLRVLQLAPLQRSRQLPGPILFRSTHSYHSVIKNQEIDFLYENRSQAFVPGPGFYDLLNKPDIPSRRFVVLIISILMSTYHASRRLGKFKSVVQTVPDPSLARPPSPPG